MALDVLLSVGVGALLPYLQTLNLRHCAFTPEAKTSVLDAGCSRLRRLVLEDMTELHELSMTALTYDLLALPIPSLQVLATAQLRQLAKLPSLSCVDFNDASCPTLFLVALGTQLTGLHLQPSHRGCLPDTQTPTPAWRATLQHVARCTRLLDLLAPCNTAAELALLAPALQQLRTLHLNGPTVEAGDGDAMVEALLGLPHLTCLQWQTSATHRLRRSYVDRPCRWQELQVGVVSPHQLARLPLHSLKQPVQWWDMMILGAVPLREVRDAVANVTRRCPAGFSWREIEGGPPNLLMMDVAGSLVDVPGVLRGLKPFLAPLASLFLGYVRWDVARVKVLGEVLPRTCVDLTLFDEGMSRLTLEQVARSMPWLRRLELKRQEVAPEDVVAYVRLARRLKEGGWAGASAVQLGQVVVREPVRPPRVGEAEHVRQWARAEREVREEGGGGVALKVVW